MIMSQQWSIRAGALVATIVATFGCSAGDSKMTVLGKRLGNAVAKVTSVSDTGSSDPVLVLEESHASRLQQIEQAIVLTRAYRDDQLREIVLEAYLSDRPLINWKQLHKKTSSSICAMVGIKQMELGLISAGEFMALVFDEVNLVPGEISSEYEVAMAPETEGKVLMTAIALASDKLNESDQNTLIKLFDDIPKEKSEIDREKVDKILVEIGELVGRKSPLAKKIVVALTLRGGLSIEQEIEMLEQLRKDTPQDESAAVASIDDFHRFLKARSNATMTMLKAIPAEKNRSLKAMIIGAAHTAKAVEKLKGDHPYVVLAGNSLINAAKDTSQMTSEEYKSRFEGKPVQRSRLSEEIFSALKKGKKPPPGLTFDLIRAENELDMIIVEAMAGGGGDSPPPKLPIGHPKLWFSDDEDSKEADDKWSGEFWEVDLSSIAWVDDNGNAVLTYDILKGMNLEELKTKQWDSQTRMPVRSKAVVFDVKLKTGNGLKYTIKTTPAIEGSSLQETIEEFRKDLIATVEAELLKAHKRLSGDSSIYLLEEKELQVFQRRPAWNVDSIIGKERSVVSQADFR